MFPTGATIEDAFASFRQEANPEGFNGPSLVASPLYHASPLRGVRQLAGGMPLVIMERFDAAKLLAAIEQHSVCSINMTPTQFVRMLALPAETKARFNLSSLRKVRHTGAACPIAVKRRMIEWLGPILVEVYGATESGPVTAISSEEWLAHPGSVGRCVEPFEADVRSEDGAPLPRGESGRLYFRDKSGRGICYYDDPQKTAAAHIEPGVFTLGEVGHVDKDGYVFIADRFSDMVISGGVNIYPAEVEKVLLTHPAIEDAAVIGVPNDEMGEKVTAIVVLAPNAAAISESDLDRFCREHLAGYKRPRIYGFVSDLGRSPLGKLNKRKLRGAYLKASLRDE